MQMSEFIIREQQRADAYRLLSALFYPPHKDALVEADVCGNLVHLTEALCPEAAEHARGLNNALQKADAQQLSVSHAKLFVGPFELQAPPYGCLYLEHGNQLMGETSVAVMKMYEDAGLRLDDEDRDAPDHIAIELEFMHYLVSREVQALGAGDNAAALEYLMKQHSFSDKYMKPWVGPFADRLYKASEEECYRLLAMYLKVFFHNTEVPGTVPSFIEAAR